MYPLLAKVDDLDAALGNSTALSAIKAHSYRAELAVIRRQLVNDLRPSALGPAPHVERPDLAANVAANNAITDRLHGRPPEHDMSEAAQQAQMQGDADPFTRRRDAAE